MDSDLSLVAGESVTLVSQTDQNWALVVSRTSGRSGHCPLNHLNIPAAAQHQAWLSSYIIPLFV
jgi:hypothetical protein